MKVLLTIRELHPDSKMGGIGNYYSLLRKYWSVNMHYFYIGRRYKDNGWIIFRLFKDFKKLNNSVKYCDILVTNPSLSSTSVLRDAVSVLIGYIHHKKIIVFFRGWHSYMVDLIDKHRFLRMLFKWVFKRADVFIVLSNDFKQKLLDWGFKKNIYIESTVVDNDLLNGYAHKGSIKKELNTINILFLARIEKDKGIFEVIEAYVNLKRKYPQIKLIIAGDGSCLEMVKQTVVNRNIKNVEFTGYVTGESKRDVLTKSDIYVFPSYGEGMPNSVLEAMAFGLPVITRSVGGVRDFFEDGRMGFITESKDPNLFAEYIEMLILNPDLRERISHFNAAFAQDHFLASIVVKRIEQIYTNVINGIEREYSWLDA